jgi:hypothetical protein
MNVVDYLKAMCKSITTSKDIMKWNVEDQVMTFYDGTNERKIKFVTQWQE